jgi:hypothetical protein
MFVLRLCEVDLFKLYYDLKKRYPSSHFGIFIDLVEHIHDQLCLHWWMEPTTQIEYIVFFFGSKLYNTLDFTNATTMEVGLVTREIWAKIVVSMKQQ